MADSPADKTEVLISLRLGWYVAEVRGRNRPNGPTPDVVSAPPSDKDQLPLRIERTPTELRIEAQKVLFQLAKQVAIATTGDSKSTEADCQKIDSNCLQLYEARTAGDTDLEAVRWADLESNFFKLDLGIQDTLAATSDTQACAYQLGRGLSEIYWQLDLDPAGPIGQEEVTWNSWTFLLGEARCNELTRLAGRLSAYFASYTAPGIAGSLAAWKKVAETEDWRNMLGPGDVAGYVRDDCLYRQVRGWYELAVLQQAPSTLIRPYAVLRNYHAVFRTLRAFWIQIVGAIASLCLVAVFLVLLTDEKNNAVVTGLIGVLSVVGVSATTITTKMKDTAQSLLSRIQADAYGDLVGLEITTVPAPPTSGSGTQLNGWRRDRTVVAAVQSRQITSANLVPQ